MRVVKKGKYDRRSLAVLDGISLHYNDQEENEDALAAMPEKKSRERRSIGGKVEKKKSNKFSKLSLKSFFSSIPAKESVTGLDLDGSRARGSGKNLKRNSVSPHPSFIDLGNSTELREQSPSQNEESKKNLDKKEEMNLIREAGHTPKLQRVKAVNPDILLDLIKDKENGEVTEPTEAMCTSTATSKAHDVSKDLAQFDQKVSKKKSKREPWRRKTIALFCGIRRNDPTSSGSNSPFEMPNGNPLGLPQRSSPRISTSTPVGIAETISKVDSLVLSCETPIQDEPSYEHTAVCVNTPKRATKIKTELKSERRILPDRQCKSATKDQAIVQSKSMLGVAGKSGHKRQTSLLHAMQESQLIAMNANGSMVVNPSVSGTMNDSDINEHANHSILSNLSKYKIRISPKKFSTTPTKREGTTRSRKLLDMSRNSTNSGTFDKTLNLSSISTTSQCSWLEKSLNSNTDYVKVTRSKSVKKVTMDTERVEIIRKGRKSVTLRRRMSSIGKGRDGSKPNISTGNRQDAGHTPRVHRKKEQPFDERLI